MNINKLITVVDDDYFTRTVISNIHDFTNHLTTTGTVERHAIPEDIAYKYIGDFYGLLEELKIDPNMWFLYMVLNGLVSPEEYDTTMAEILIPDPELVSQVLDILTFN